MATTKKSARKRAATKKPTRRGSEVDRADALAPKLTDDQRAYVVRRIAYYDTPKEIADGLRDEFGVEITRQSVEFYDPEKNTTLSKKWADLHATARAAFLNETAKVPAAERAYRMLRLHRMAQKAESRGNYPLASAILKQCAEEMGGKYTNKLEHSGIPAMPSVMQVVIVDPKAAP